MCPSYRSSLKFLAALSIKCQSFYSLILSSFLLFFISIPLSAQDLIERTQLGMQSEPSEKVNEIAKFMAKKWKRNNARNGAYNLFEFNNESSDQANLSAVVTDAVYLDMNPTNLNNLLRERPEQLSLAIPVDAKSAIALDLVEVDITSFDFEIILSSGALPPSVDNIAFYRGIVKGNTNSWAAISVFNGEIMGVVADEYGNYVLGGLDNSSQYTFFNDHNFVESLPFDCAFVDEESTETGGFRTDSPESSGRNSTSNCVKIYFEADHHSYGNLGSNATNVTNYVMGAFNSVSTIYQNEQISIQMSGLKVWDTPDSYGGTKGANCSPVLNNFWSAMEGNFTGDLAHLITAINPAGGYSVCGFAYLGCACGSTPSACKVQAFCNNFAPEVGYSQTLNTYNDFPTYSWTVNVLAHELGHNFGSPHTQACAWNGNNTAIDGCVPVESQLLYGSGCSTSTANCSRPAAVDPGTIMSYCHQTTSIDLNSGFGQQPGDLIRSNVANANCLTVCVEESNDLGDGVCRAAMMVTDSDIPGATGNYRSASAIETDGNSLTISAGETVNFLSTSAIILKTGFHATASSNFTAKIESCTVPSLQTEDAIINQYLAAIQTEEVVENLQVNDFIIVPNPANDQVSFTFDLAEDSDVSIQIYDLSGQLMEIVLNHQLRQKGYNEVTHLLSSLQSGMFYTVLNIEGKLSTKKMIIVK